MPNNIGKYLEEYMSKSRENNWKGGKRGKVLILLYLLANCLLFYNGSNIFMMHKIMLTMCKIVWWFHYLAGCPPSIILFHFFSDFIFFFLLHIQHGCQLYWSFSYLNTAWIFLCFHLNSEHPLFPWIQSL